MKALVTGAAGFIGSHLCDRLLADGHEVAGLDSFTDYYSRTLKEGNLDVARSFDRFTLHEIDLVEDELEPAVEGVDVVFHMAGRSGIRSSRRNQFDHYVRDNVLATQRLLDAVRHRRLKRFVFGGSSSVYGDAQWLPTKETTLPRPLSPYGVTKLAAENLVYMHSRNFGMPAVTLRYFYVYGPRQRPDMAIARFMRGLLEDSEVEVFGDGEQTRDFTYINDIVAATMLAADSNLADPILNVGAGSRATVNAVIQELEALAGTEVRRRHVPASAEDHRHGGASINLARQQLNWEPKVSLREGLSRQLTWFQEQTGREARSLIPV